MKISIDKQNSFLIILAAAFAAIYSWIEYYILVGVLQEAIYTKIIFWMAYLAMAFAFATINAYAGFASFATGAFIEDLLYRFLSKSNYLDWRLMVGLFVIVLALMIRATIIFEKNDKQKFELPKVPEPTYKEEPIIIPKEEIDKVKQDPNFTVMQQLTPEMKTGIIEGIPVVIDIGKEEKFDPEKEEMKKRIKERYLEKMRKKYNGA